MFRFTIRDVLWLIALTAMALAWWADHRATSRLCDKMYRRVAAADTCLTMIEVILENDPEAVDKEWLGKVIQTWTAKVEQNRIDEYTPPSTTNR